MTIKTEKNNLKNPRVGRKPNKKQKPCLSDSKKRPNEIVRDNKSTRFTRSSIPIAVVISDSESDFIVNQNSKSPESRKHFFSHIYIF